MSDAETKGLSGADSASLGRRPSVVLAVAAVAIAVVGILSLRIEAAPDEKVQTRAMMQREFDVKEARGELDLLRSALAEARWAQRSAGEWEGRLVAEIASDGRRVDDLVWIANDSLKTAAGWNSRVDTSLARVSELLDGGSKGSPK